MLDISDDGLYKFSDRDIRKVSQIMVIKEEDLIALLAGQSASYIYLVAGQSASYNYVSQLATRVT